MFDDVHNYYEKIVYDRVLAQVGKKSVNSDFLEDVACAALNHLPPRYIRFEVDMLFYLSPIERQEIEDKVDAAISLAIKIVKENKSRGTRR
ncbi:MAG: late competence development ComFB family protein [Gammaproteobacteria bacterium]|nr:late competence development ComFB family protein [Gammaproteobacteria bacterium]